MYDGRSNYIKTPIVNNTYLDIMVDRYIFLDPNDEIYEIEQKYHKRPDLFSYHRYGTSKYWWVFARRNTNILIDPINDFVTGTTIKIPSFKNLENTK
jgi:hypothetical protein